MGGESNCVEGPKRGLFHFVWQYAFLSAVVNNVGKIEMLFIFDGGSTKSFLGFSERERENVLIQYKKMCHNFFGHAQPHGKR